MNKISALISGLPLLLGVSGAQASDLYGGAQPMNVGDLSGATAMAAVDSSLAALGALLGSSNAFGSGLDLGGAGSTGAGGITSAGGTTSTDSQTDVTSSAPTTPTTPANTSNSAEGVQVSSASISTVNSRSVTQTKTQTN